MVEKLADTLTGFSMDVVLRQELEEHPKDFLVPTIVIIFDVARLRIVNKEKGRQEGDRQIKDLGDNMRKYLPKETMFYRGYESEALAIIKNRDEKSIIDAVNKIVEVCVGTIYFGIDTLTEEKIKNGQTLNEVIDNAYAYLRIKQILNFESDRSHVLTTYINTLKQVDSDTEQHVKRTQASGLALGRKIGLSSSDLAALELLCLLHDIGKITVPLEILNKPGLLTDDEWKVLRSHASNGYEMISSLNELKPIANSVLSHHERWDGKGYPNGLKGENIPILARIISVVDAFDAMINDRSYRKALTIEDAKLEIRDNAGTQFDPVLAKEFLELLDEHPEYAQTTINDKEINAYRKRMPPEIGIGVTEVVPFAEYTLDVNYRIIDVGQNFFEYTGYTKEEAVEKMTQFDLIPKEEVQHYRAVAAKEYTKRDYAYLTHPIVRKDGSLMMVLCIGERYYDSALKIFKTRIIITKK